MIKEIITKEIKETKSVQIHCTVEKENHLKFEKHQSDSSRVLVWFNNCVLVLNKNDLKEIINNLEIFNSETISYQFKEKEIKI